MVWCTVAAASPRDDVQVSPLCLSSRGGSLTHVKTEAEHADDVDNDVLNTADVAQFVRHVLISRNIGQRQFARGVLNLSQGTVSELLAKPKPWDRLSEKGRESYRRMYQWAVEQTGTTGLCLDSPQNGESCSCCKCKVLFYYFVITFITFSYCNFRGTEMVQVTPLRRTLAFSL